MKKINCAVDYRKLRLNNLNSPEFSHLLMLLFWPVYGIVFMVLEKCIITEYNMVYMPFDDVIPFCEYFVVPYYFWFVYIIGMLAYTMFFNIEGFRKFMMFIIISNSLTLLIYLLYPTAQDLRPVVFVRDNIFTDIVKMLYSFDTNTNVCPSIHVINSLAVWFTTRHDEKISQSAFWRSFFTVSTILISLSTVFLKQHSVIDVIAGVILSVIVYPVVFRKVQILDKKTEKFI